MTARLRHRRSEIENAGRIARELGLVVRLEADGAITLMPQRDDRAPVDTQADLDLDAELAAFEAKHGHR